MCLRVALLAGLLLIAVAPAAGTALEDPTPPSVLANARAFASSGGNFPGGPAMIDTVRSVNIATQAQWTLPN